MKIEKTISVKFTDEELVRFIGDRVVDLEEDEDYILVHAYTSFNEYVFRVVKKEKDE